MKELFPIQGAEKKETNKVITDICSDVEFEAPIIIDEKAKKAGEKSKKADAVIILDNRYKIIIEVRKHAGSIRKDHENQILRDMHHSDANLGIIINADRLRLCRKRSVRKGYGSPNTLFELKFDQFEKYPQVINLLSKKNMEKGLTEKAVRLFSEEWKKEWQK